VTLVCDFSHYTDNDPLNKTDPTGLRPGDCSFRNPGYNLWEHFGPDPSDPSSDPNARWRGWPSLFAEVNESCGELDRGLAFSLGGDVVCIGDRHWEWPEHPGGYRVINEEPPASAQDCAVSTAPDYTPDSLAGYLLEPLRAPLSAVFENAPECPSQVWDAAKFSGVGSFGRAGAFLMRTDYSEAWAEAWGTAAIASGQQVSVFVLMNRGYDTAASRLNVSLAVVTAAGTVVDLYCTGADVF